MTALGLEMTVHVRETTCPISTNPVSGLDIRVRLSKVAGTVITYIKRYMYIQ